MAGPEKRTESIPQGPKPKGEKPQGPRPPKEKLKALPTPTTPEEVRFAPPPLTREKAREGMAGVRDRAEAAMHEMEYEARVMMGEMKREFMKARLDARLEFRKKGKKGFFIDHAVTSRVYERMRTFRNKRKEWKRARLEAKQDLSRYLRARQLEALSVVTHISVPAGDTEKLSRAYRKFDDAVPENFEHLKKEEQLRLAGTIVTQFGVSEDPAYVRVVLLDLEKQKDDVALMERALEEERVAMALISQSAETDDPEKAMASALKEGSPELQKAYEEYLEVWRSENVTDVFAPPVPEIPGAEVLPFGEERTAAAIAAINKEKKGVTIHMGSQYLGEVHFGKFVRPCAFYAVDGEPKLFIFDPNADTGRRGPINLNPAEVRAELAHALIDDEFSRQFRHFVGRGTEVDPQKIADAKLFEIVHKFLPPGSDEHMDRLDATQQSIIINLAILFATPDKKYISLQDKARFLNDLKPDRLAIAKIKLQEQCFPEKFSLSEFASSLTPS